MVKNDRFTFKLDVEERRLLELLAHRLQRTQSDTMRWLLRQTAAALLGSGSAGEQGGIGD